MNSTNYYALSQIEPTDKPTWLVMYNSDMLKIDTGIHEAKAAADAAGTAAAAAQSTADAATSNLATLSGTVGSLASELTTAIGNINTINSLIGNGTPTTTDQTIIGAINEINAHVSELDDAVVGLILEREERITFTADINDTNVNNLTAFRNAINAFIATLDTDERWEIDNIFVNDMGAYPVNRNPSRSSSISMDFYRTTPRYDSLDNYFIALESDAIQLRLGSVTSNGYVYTNMDSSNSTGASWFCNIKIWRRNS